MFEARWADFLMAANGVYTKLEQGSKGNEKSGCWFKRQRSNQKQDPLLRYLRQARNAEEHGIRRVTERVSSKIMLEPGGSISLESDGTQWIVKSAERVVPALDRVILVTVFGTTFNDRCDPPRRHLGQPLTNAAPQTVAALAITYLQSVLEEARRLTL